MPVFLPLALRLAVDKLSYGEGRWARVGVIAPVAVLIATVIGLFLADDGHKYAGIVHADHNGRSGLTGHHTGFQSDGVLTVLEGFRNFIKHWGIPF